MVTLLPDGSIQIPPQPSLSAGAHRVALVVGQPMERPALQLTMRDVAHWPAGRACRREALALLASLTP